MGATQRERRLALLHGLLLLLAFGLLQIGKPVDKLSFRLPELAYLLVSVPFVAFRLVHWRIWWKHLCVAQLLFTVVHYQIHGSLSIVSVLLATLPAVAIGLVRFSRWNVECIRDRGAWGALGVSLISWVAMALSFPPLPLGPAAPVLLAPWFIILLTRSPQRVLFATFWSGIVYNALNYYWIYNVISVGPAGIILMGLALLIVFFTLFQVLAAWLFVRGRHWPVFRWTFPLIWAGLEVLRSRGEFSFPWSHVGYVFGNHVELLQLLPHIGVFGYSILIIGSNLVLAQSLLQRRWWALALPALLPLLLWVQGERALHRDAEQQGSGEYMDIVLVQPSIHQTKKWSKAYYDTVMQRTWAMLDTLETANADLVVLPETAVPDFLRLRDPDYRRFRRYAGERGIDVLVGALNYDRQGKGGRKYNYYNSAYLFTPTGEIQEYRKIHLVPFSERLPLEDVFPLLTYVDLGEGDFTPGTELPLYGGELRYTPNICYETIYPSLVREAVRKGARILVNITNDGWFGRSTAPGQHANLARYRSIESALPMARCANSGISVFYDHRGRDFERTRLYEQVTVRHRLPLRAELTLYTRIGDAVETGLFILFWCALFLVLFRAPSTHIANK